MRILILALTAILITTALSFSQTPGYFLTYGNPDGSPLVVLLDSDIEVKMWVETPPDGDLDGNGIVDSIGFIFNVLASNDSFVVSMDSGEVYFPLTTWDDINFYSSGPDGRLTGYTAQVFLSFCDVEEPPGILINTESQKVHVASFYMHTQSDSTYLYQTVSVLAEGMISVTGQFTMWGLPAGTISIIPEQAFSPFYFADYDYIAGDANNSGTINGLDVIYLVNYLKQTGPPPDPFLAADANGNCIVNGLDAIYLANYFRGTGFPPQLGICP